MRTTTFAVLGVLLCALSAQPAALTVNSTSDNPASNTLRLTHSFNNPPLYE